MKLNCRLWVLAALLAISLAPAAVADQLTMVGVYASRTGGTNPVEYLTPYKLSINGGPTVLGICDDFWTSVTVGSKWTADPHTSSDMTGLKFGDQGIEKYYQAAYLSNILLSIDLTKASTLADQTSVSFAIWQIFNTKTTDSPLNHLSATLATQAQAYITQAQQYATASSMDGWTVYTPNPLNASQEMLVRAPEASAFAMLGLNVFGLLGLAVVFRRRIQVG